MYTCEHTVVASLERQNLKCELDQEGNEKSIFTMIPKSKIDRDGDVVYSHQEFRLKVNSGQPMFLHFSLKDVEASEPGNSIKEYNSDTKAKFGIKPNCLLLSAPPPHPPKGRIF